MKEGNERCILLVEDNDLDAERIRRALKNEKAVLRVQRVTHGGEALDALHDNKALGRQAREVLVLLDLNLPRVSGLEFLQRLRADSELSDIPVVILTTSALKSDIQEAYRHNVLGYIVKPLDSATLRRAVLAISEFWSVCEPPSRRFR